LSADASPAVARAALQAAAGSGERPILIREAISPSGTSGRPPSSSHCMRGLGRHRCRTAEATLSRAQSAVAKLEARTRSPSAPAWVPGTEHPRLRTSGRPTSTPPPGKRHGLPNLQPSHQLTRLPRPPASRKPRGTAGRTGLRVQPFDLASRLRQFPGDKSRCPGPHGARDGDPPVP
jgi:hypothetical protein